MLATIGELSMVPKRGMRPEISGQPADQMHEDCGEIWDAQHLQTQPDIAEWPSGGKAAPPVGEAPRWPAMRHNRRGRGWTRAERLRGRTRGAQFVPGLQANEGAEPFRQADHRQQPMQMRKLPQRMVVIALAQEHPGLLIAVGTLDPHPPLIALCRPVGAGL